MKLAEVQRLMHELLRGQAAPDEVAAALGADARRLAIYRDFVARHVADALDKNFVYTRALLGDHWGALVDRYYRERPAHHWELNAAGEAFPDFLEEQRAAGHGRLTPFHVVLAQFEWEEWVAFAHPARIPAPEEVQAPALNPTLAVLESPYALVDFLVAHRDALSPELPLPAPLPAPQTLLVFRHPVGLLANAVAAGTDLLLAMKMAAEAIPVAAAAEATGRTAADVRTALGAAAERGVIILPAAW